MFHCFSQKSIAISWEVCSSIGMGKQSCGDSESRCQVTSHDVSVPGGDIQSILGQIHLPSSSDRATLTRCQMASSTSATLSTAGPPCALGKASVSHLSLSSVPWDIVVRMGVIKGWGGWPLVAVPMTVSYSLGWSVLAVL